MFSSFGGGGGGGGGGAEKKGKGKPEDSRNQLRIAAAQAINEQRALVKGPMEKMQTVATSSYWKYGYMGSILFAAGGLTMAVGSRFPAVASVGGLASLGAGMYGGPYLHNMHVVYLKTGVVTVLDKNITALNGLEAEHGMLVPEYREELKALNQMKAEMGAEAARAAGLLAGDGFGEQEDPGATLDTKVDNIIASFEKRKSASAGKA
jgi:hypothetical protein